MSGAATVRLGLIGAGRWGRNIIRSTMELDGVELLRVASRNPETALLTGDRCAVTADWREVAAAPDLDGVVIAAPAPRHAEMARVVIDAGRSLLVEKPLALRVADAEALLAAAAGRRLVAMVDHVHLHNPAWAALKRHLPPLGRVRRIRSAGGNHGPFRGEVRALWDYGSHDLALCLDLLGSDPATIRAELVETRRESEGEGEIVRAMLVFPDGVEAEVTVGNLIAPKVRRFEVEAKRGKLVFDDLAPTPLVLLGKRGGPQPLPSPGAVPLTAAIGAFAEAIRVGAQDIGSLELGVRVVRLLARIDAALAVSGRPPARPRSGV